MNAPGSTIAKAVVEATFDDRVWAAAVNDLGPERTVAILRQVYKDIGMQMSQRAASMANTRDSDDVDDAEYRAAKADYNDWLRRATTIRRRVAARLTEIQPIAQSIRDLHQADRRVALRLAKRIWMWEQGMDHHLGTALDDLDCSLGDRGRRPLREIVDALVAGADGEIIP